MSGELGIAQVKKHIDHVVGDARLEGRDHRDCRRGVAIGNVAGDGLGKVKAQVFPACFGGDRFGGHKVTVIGPTALEGIADFQGDTGSLTGRIDPHAEFGFGAGAQTQRHDGAQHSRLTRRQAGPRSAGRIACSLGEFDHRIARSGF